MRRERQMPLLETSDRPPLLKLVKFYNKDLFENPDDPDTKYDPRRPKQHKPNQPEYYEGQIIKLYANYTAQPSWRCFRVKSDGIEEYNGIRGEYFNQPIT